LTQFSTDKLRNVALISHGGAGKTSLAEGMLFRSGTTTRLGNVDEGTSILDSDPQEIKRKMSINTSIASCEWNKHKINLLDTPGYFDFVGEVKAALRVCDGAIVTVCGASGVEVGSEKVWEYADEYGLPRIVFVNKMDRENANFDKVLEEIQGAFGVKVTPVQLPIGQADGFKGIVDLIQMKAYVYDDQGNPQETDIPEDMQDRVDAAREALMDSVAVGDDEVMMKYLEGEPLSGEEVASCLGKGTRTREVIPLLVGSAKKQIGTDLLLDYCIHCLPSPADVPAVTGVKPGTDEEVTRAPSIDEPLAALVFKTMADPYVGRLNLLRVYSGILKSDTIVFNANKGQQERVGQVYLVKGKEQEPVDQVCAGDLAAVAKLQNTTTSDVLCDESDRIILKPINFPAPSITMAVEPKNRGDEEKIGTGLNRLTEEDPTFTVRREAETSQILISGTGEMHLAVMKSRLESKFDTEVELVRPKIPYRETITKKAEGEHKHKKQTGGRGQYGHVFLRLEPSTEEFEFVDEIFGGAVPKQYIPAVEKGVQETMSEGVLAAYPVVNVKTTLYDGSYHSVDSSEMAFKIAAAMAFKKAFLDAGPVLLEPIVEAEIIVPEENMGDIMGDMNKKRGRILGMDPQNGKQVIKAEAPLAEMFRYAIDLRSMTQGRGSFTMEFKRYEQVPPHIAEEIIAAAKKDED